MRFAHFADCHIGSWRDPKMREISVRAFVKAIDIVLQKKVDFVVISGDLFNTSVPSIDSLKDAVDKLKSLNNKGIPVYGIAGSHDFSASGKTMLDVLERAGIFTNIFRGKVEDKKLRLEFTTDKRTGAKLTGIIGRKGMLDRRFYEDLERSELEKEEGYKIFLFHTAISEIKPKELERMHSAPMNALPKGFNYYAGGHVHYIFRESFPEYGWIAYPGALFPTNFHDLEKYSRGGFYIVDVDEKSESPEESIEWVPVQVMNTFHLDIDCNGKTPGQVEEEIYSQISNKEFFRTIVTMRLHGTLSRGNPSDIDFKSIYGMLFDKSAYYIMKSVHALFSRDFEKAKPESASESVEEVEENIIGGQAGSGMIEGMDAQKEKDLMRSLMHILSAERHEDEKVAEFEKRVIDDAERVMEF
ncbi:MAG: DNA repair exonuclease [Candidatus Woesearchaeota archaeon]